MSHFKRTTDLSRLVETLIGFARRFGRTDGGKNLIAYPRIATIGDRPDSDFGSHRGTSSWTVIGHKVSWDEWTLTGKLVATSEFPRHGGRLHRSFKLALC